MQVIMSLMNIIVYIAVAHYFFMHRVRIKSGLLSYNYNVYTMYLKIMYVK